MTENMTKFLETVSQDEALKSELEALMKNSNKKTANSQKMSFKQLPAVIVRVWAAVGRWLKVVVGFLLRFSVGEAIKYCCVNYFLLAFIVRRNFFCE